MKPEDVFTPASPVRDEMFATRRHLRLQERAERALAERGRQIVLYGLTGVGKTSLVQHLCRQLGISMIRVECGTSFDNLVLDALAQVLRSEEVEQIERTSKELGLSAGLSRYLNFGGKTSKETEIKRAPLPRSPGGLLAETLARVGVQVLFLDNFENLAGKAHGAETRKAITELIKLFSDRSADGASDEVKLVIAGIPSASEELLALDDAAARRTTQIEVDRMPPSELDQILSRGGDNLGIAFEGFARERIVSFSDGFPYYTHLFGLHCSRRVLADERTEVTVVDFEESLAAILADCDLSLRRAYDAAVEKSGDVRIRKSVMEALASLNDLEVPFKAIREAFVEIHPKYREKPESLNVLNIALKPLKEDHGILTDRGKPKSRNNMYRFTNPLMRAYVRLRQHQERQGRLDI